MLLEAVRVVLVKTRFPENIGMAARACANMGCPALHLVEPERWIREKAVPLATPKGVPVLDDIHIHTTLSDAVCDANLVVGTTARTGGWRREIISPRQASTEIAEALSRDEKIAVVFGPEDRGLDNAEITACQRLVTIPTDGEASSLNLAQSVLLVLYEFANAVRDKGKNISTPHAASMTAGEMARFFDAFKAMLLQLDCLHGDNPDYFFLPWQRFFSRAGLRRHEYDALMGLCRQVHSKLRKA